MDANEPTTLSGRKKAIFIAVFVLLATSVTAVLGEVAMRVVVARKLIYNIEMVRYAKELKMVDPAGVVSHVHRPSRSAKLMGVDISLNSLGHRGPELAATRDVATKRLLVFGSSVTMGWGVPFDEVFTSRVQKSLNDEHPFGPEPRFEVANAGIGNYNTFFQRKLFDKQYDVVKPDMVVLHYFISDAEPRGKPRNNPLFKHSYLAAYLYDRFRVLEFLFGKKNDLFSFYDKLYVDGSEAWASTQADIKAMQERTAKDHVPFLIMIIPDFHNLGPQTPYGPLYAKMEKAFTAMGIPTVNTFPAFQTKFGSSERDLWIQADDPHPNGKGHALMAELFVEHVKREDPLRLRH